MSRFSPARAILALTFIESFGTILLERGVYFYTHDVLQMSEAQNLWLAAGFGVTYVIGALLSHRVAERFGERRLLVASLVALLAVHVALAAQPTRGLLTICFPVIGLLQGIKWPVVESFVSAGRSAGDLAAFLGRFNVTWAAAVPLALAGSGPLIATGWPSLLFVTAALCNVTGLVAAAAQPERPVHLDESHPTRPAEAEQTRLSALLEAARWSMLLSYGLLFLLAPLLPDRLAALELSVTSATAVASVLDVARVVAFWAFGMWLGWRGRTWPILAAIAVLPLTFLVVLFADDIVALLLAEVVFGASSGLLYTAALYYALWLKNAAVEAGGAHEGLIGLGFVLGPLAGLAAQILEPALGTRLAATLVSVSPLCLVFTGVALRRLLAAR
jgi:MFS family permease